MNLRKRNSNGQVDALRSERMNRGLAASLEYREYYTGNTYTSLCRSFLNFKKMLFVIYS